MNGVFNPEKIKLIVGLGNPGSDYENTYHNAGFLALKYLSENAPETDWRQAKKFSYIKTSRFILVKPEEFMNESGNAVKEALKYFKSKKFELLLVHDDSDLESGKWQIKLETLDRTGNQLQAVRPDAPYDSVNSMSWSPDGRFLAFILAFADDQPGKLQIRLMVYDRIAHQSVEMCSLNDDDRPTHNIETNRPVWSPDSRYIVYGVGADKLSDTNGIMIIDIFTGEITTFKKGRGITFVGWSEFDAWLHP